MDRADSLDYCLQTRRSIRKYTDRPISRDIIDDLLNAAILAPSASNLQPWKFIVIDDAELLDKIKAFSPGIGGIS